MTWPQKKELCQSIYLNKAPRTCELCVPVTVRLINRLCVHTQHEVYHTQSMVGSVAYSHFNIVHNCPKTKIFF